MTERIYGPTLPISQETHAAKYRGKGESFRDYGARVAGELCDDEKHFDDLVHILWEQRFLPAGRVQSAIGSPRQVTAFNCFVSDTIEDSMEGIMKSATEGALTMKLGGGIGYDFSTLRPRGAYIKSVEAQSSGAVSFMQVHDAVHGTVESAGNRRGAGMIVLRIDHPDIEEYIEAKTNETNLTNFNVSVAVTDKFMRALKAGKSFDLEFGGVVSKQVDARALWNKLMRATWDWAEPGVLFIDRINELNNLQYCETLAATNPCGEQPLPPHGACLLGSFNFVKYLKKVHPVSNSLDDYWMFDILKFQADIPRVVRAMDNVIDRTIYPLKAQEVEAKAKRRMGLGGTGLANAGEVLGYRYGSEQFLAWEDALMKFLSNQAYKASALLAKEKGKFPMYTREYLDSKYVQGLDPETITLIDNYGIRNSHLISFAPTGTISLTADNVSASIEPPYNLEFSRDIIKPGGKVTEVVKDWAWATHGIEGKTADTCTVDEHLSVLLVATKWSDSAVSKTINVGDQVGWEEFKDVYVKAWEGGAKGCTTFRKAGKRFGVLRDVEPVQEGTACYIDPDSGKRSCD